MISTQRINRKPGLLKTLVNQCVTAFFRFRVINRVIDPKVALCNFPDKTLKFGLSVRHLMVGTRKIAISKSQYFLVCVDLNNLWARQKLVSISFFHSIATHA
jgi:hypothetical protein